MAYTVFARKYRPQRFDEVVGQQALARTLRNAVAQGRVAHAYLFCGPRGTGKTSTARILAKALNCAALEGGEPCNACEPCVTITEGRNLDVDEFDAASNRGVEDVEALTQRVRAPRPARRDSRYRIFIVDEVHMMSRHAFNALLKTLEEPPPHVKFIFCTTEPEGLPETITSRCQRFDFKRIGRDDIVARLEQICAHEGIEAERRALRLVAERARGGMRDAQSLLDQAVALAAEPGAENERIVLRLERLERALGMAPRERVRRLFAALAEGAVPAVLEQLDAVFADGFDAGELCGQAAALARDLMVLSSCGFEAGKALLAEPDDAEALQPLVEALGAERALFAMGQFVELETRLRTARDERLLIELCFVKLARLRELVSLREMAARLRALEERVAGGPSVAGPAADGVADAATVPRARSTAAAANANANASTAAAVQPDPSAPLDLEAVRTAYAKVVEMVRGESPGFAAVADKARLLKLEGEVLTLGFESAFDRKRVFERDGRLRPNGRGLEQRLAHVLGRPIRLRAAETPGEEKPRRRRRTREEVLREPEVQRVMDRSRGGVLLGYEEIEQEPQSEG